MATANPIQWLNEVLPLGAVPRRLAVVLSSPAHHMAAQANAAAVAAAVSDTGLNAFGLQLDIATVLRPSGCGK